MLTAISRSIRHKFTLVVLAATLAALTVTGVAMVIYDLRTFEHAGISDLDAQGEILGRASAPALDFEDPKAAAEYLQLLKAKPEVSSAAIYNARGKVFASYMRGDQRSPVPALPETEGSRVDGADIILFKRIVKGNEILGTVYLKADFKLRERLIGYLGIFTVVTVLSLIVALLLSTWLQGVVIQPILATSSVARRVVETRDYSLRVAKTTSDEVGGLVDAFNDMVAEVGRRSEALEASNRVLEHEVAERKRAEVALLRAHEMAKLAHVITGANGVFESWSDTLPGLMGMSNGKLPRDTREWLALIHPDDQANFRARAIEAAKSGARTDVQYRMPSRGGGWIHIKQAIEPLEGSGHAGTRWLCTLQDVTMEMLAEQRIRGQLEHLRLLDQITRSTGERLDLKSIFQVVVGTLEDSLPVDFGCVCLYDPAANMLTVSSVGAKSAALARELTMDTGASVGVDSNGLSRCVLGQLVYEPDVVQVRFPFAQRLASGGLHSVVMAPLRSESRVFGILVVARRAAEAFESVECEFLRQLSEHVALAAHQAQLYESLQRAYDDLRRTQETAMQQERLRALGQMASGIAHDINNALSPVSLYTESMLETEKGLSARARGQLETIRLAVDDVAHTVARMREFYRQREEQVELAPVDVNLMARQVLDLTRARWSDEPLKSGVVIQTRPELAADLPRIMGVESEIREALTNLVFNAVDAMPAGGTLTLRTRLAGAAPDQSVIVEVTDTGAGMDEQTRKRCLEPFFTTKGERGTGLGLAMVFGMVQRHSSEIEIDSVPGMGTTVRLAFAVPTAVLADHGGPAAAPETPKHLRLLVIDDDPVLLKSLRDALEADEHEVATASGGRAGIDAFRAAREPYAAVITDLGMPYVDGRQVAAAVKQASPATPVILLTGWGQRMAAEGDIPTHVDRVLAKPPKLRELREALAQLCPA
jgi:signal transduction histidine kinase